MKYTAGREFLVELKADYEVAVGELEVLRAQVVAATQNVQRLEAAISAVAPLVDDESTPVVDVESASEFVNRTFEPLATNGGPKVRFPVLKDSILLLMNEENRPWTITELLEAIARRNWLKPTIARPVDALRTAAIRLGHEGLIRKVGVSTYELRQPTLDGLSDGGG